MLEEEMVNDVMERPQKPGYLLGRRSFGFRGQIQTRRGGAHSRNPPAAGFSADRSAFQRPSDGRIREGVIDVRLMAWGRADGLLGVAPPRAERSGKCDQEIERVRNWAARTASRWYATRPPNLCASRLLWLPSLTC